MDSGIYVVRDESMSSDGKAFGGDGKLYTDEKKHKQYHVVASDYKGHVGQTYYGSENWPWLQ